MITNETKVTLTIKQLRSLIKESCLVTERINDRTILDGTADYFCIFMDSDGDQSNLLEEINLLKNTEPEKATLNEATAEFRAAPPPSFWSKLRGWARENLGPASASRSHEQARAAVTMIEYERLQDEGDIQAANDLIKWSGATTGERLAITGQQMATELGTGTVDLASKVATKLWEFIKPLVMGIKDFAVKALIGSAATYALYKAAPWIFGQVGALWKRMRHGDDIAKCKFTSDGTDYVCTFDLKSLTWKLNYAPSVKHLLTKHPYPSDEETESFFETDFFNNFKDRCQECIEPVLDSNILDKYQTALESSDNKSKEGREAAKILQRIEDNATAIRNNMFGGKYSYA